MERLTKDLFKVKHCIAVLLVMTFLSCGVIGNEEAETDPQPQYEDGIVIDSSNRMVITQYGISWIFDKFYETGQFINGDYYIIGPAKLVAIYPVPSGGLNGSMINPPVADAQAFDSRAHAYDMSLAVALPRDLIPGESLISSKSIPERGTYKDFAGVDVLQVWVQSAAVLTCLDEHPAQGTFRPPYFGTSKPLYTFNGLTENMLPELNYDLNTVKKYIFDTPYDYYIRGFKRPWIIHVFDWVGRGVHPYENMKNYHQDIDLFFGQASLLLMIDPGDMGSKREELLMYYLQCGLDYYSMCTQGHGDCAFNAWPVIFTGLMLDEPAIYNTFVNGASQYDPAEIKMTYYLPGDITSARTSSVLPEGTLWTGYVHPSGTVPAYRQDPHDDEHEHLDVTEWYGCGDDVGGAKREAYRRINSCTYPAYVLCALIMDDHNELDVRSLVNHDALFDYTDRWMTEDMTTHIERMREVWGSSKWGNTTLTYYNTSRSTFVDGMWSEYRDAYK